MRKISLLGAAASVLFLTACGNSPGEQALFGGAAGVGAAAVTGGDPVVGGVLGAGANVGFCQLYPAQCRR